MSKSYKNIPVPEEVHAIIKEEAWRRRTSIAGLIKEWASKIDPTT
jgi:hypothetical protein